MNTGIQAPSHAPPAMPNGLLGRPAPVTTPRGKKQRFGYDPSNLTLVYDTSLEPANLQVSAPLDGVVNVVIDWGDGTSEAHTSSGYKLHTYAAPGVYVVQISGRMTAMRHSAVATPGLSKLIRCLSFGDLGITSLNEAFRNCINLIECPPSLPASVTTMTLCFFSCAQFNDPNVCLWNTRNVTAMTQMFQGATRFNQPVGGWDTSSVTTMQGMFVACIAFNQPIGNWDTRRVISFVNMFNAATSFNQQIGGWNTSSTSAIRTMFSGATSFRQTLHGWNMSNVSSMDQLFVNSNYNQDVSNWDIRRATTLSSSFTPFWGNENYSAALIAWAALPDTDLAAVPITAFAVSGARTRVTNSGNHGVVVGSRVRITGTTNYNGDYNVAATPSGNTFEIDTPFVANDATGTMAVRRSLNVILNPGASVKYLPDAAAARDTLINTYGWVITDGGQV